MRNLKNILLTGALLWFSVPIFAQENGEAETAWENLQKAMLPTSPPADWRGRIPTRKEMDAFRIKQAETAGKAADLAAEFAKKFPVHPKTAQARRHCHELLSFAVQRGLINRVKQLETVETEILKKESLTQEQRFEIRRNAVERGAILNQQKGATVMLNEYEAGVRELQKEFPNTPEIYQMLYAVAVRSSGKKAALLAREIVTHANVDVLKLNAQKILTKAEQIGKPVSIKFTAVDGRKVDLAKMKGKVVLIDFWATWCAPCIAELPATKAAYEKYHERGFEIIGISLDQDKSALTAMTEHKKLPWPQHFEDEQKENRFAKRYSIESIPTLWLIDKDGNVSDMNARVELLEKVEKLLKEKPTRVTSGTN